jgi:hypothetical protein
VVVADRTTWAQVDLTAGDPLPGEADLVSAMYIHLPEAAFDRVYNAIAAAVRPGGTLLVTGHHPAERDTQLRNPHLSHLLFAPEQVTALLPAGWRIDVADARTREVSGPDGASTVATNTVVVARRESV